MGAWDYGLLDNDDAASAIDEVMSKILHRAAQSAMSTMSRQSAAGDARARGVLDAPGGISGHATPAMQLHYFTARGGEVKQALAKVAKIATAGAAIIDIRRARERLR